MIFTTPSSNGLWIDADQAEERCHLGPESRAFMADMQYPVYGIILNIIPYTYPAIVGFLVVAALHERIFTRGRTSAFPDEPTKRVFGLGTVPLHQPWYLQQ